MKILLLSAFLFALSTSNSFGFTEASCDNCSESQARAAARNAAPNTNYTMHRVYVHDLETYTFRSYDVWHETEENMSITLSTNVQTPTSVKDEWDNWTVLADVILEPFPPIIVPPTPHDSAYDLVNNVLGLETLFNNHVGALTGWDLSSPLLQGVASSLQNKVDNVENAITIKFSDGSSITMRIVSYNITQKRIVIEFGSAINDEGLSIFQDPSVLEGSSFDMNSSTDSFYDYLRRNNISVVDYSGNVLDYISPAATGGWVCYANNSDASVTCRFQQN